MSRLAKILALGTAVVAVVAITAACGSESISVPKDQTQLYHGATVFNERCAGCHTLSYAATFGSAPNIRTAQAISGPNFNQRCERPVDRVLYAIANGGFSGAYMPQNVVVGQDAVDVAKFVATYAGRQAPHQIGVRRCQAEPVGTLPAYAGTTVVVPYPGSTARKVAAVGALARKTTTARAVKKAAAKRASSSAKSGKSGAATSSGTSTSGH